MSENVLMFVDMYNPNFYDPVFSPFNNTTHIHNDQWFVIMSFEEGVSSVGELRQYFQHVKQLHTREVGIFRQLVDANDIPMHPTVRNYTKYHELPFEKRVEIGQIIYSDDNVALCVLKTFWLRIFQRRVRTYIAKIRRFRQHAPQILFRRQLTGIAPLKLVSTC